MTIRRRKYQSTIDLIDRPDIAFKPVRMVDMSETAEGILDTINHVDDPAAFRPTAYFATAVQGEKADTALQNPNAFATAAQGAKADSALQNAALFATAAEGAKAANLDDFLIYHRDKLTTTTANVTPVRTLTIATNSIMFVDIIATFQNAATNLTGGYIWATLSFGRATGAPVALGSLDILESHNQTGCAVTIAPNGNNIEIAVRGRASTTIKWSLRTTADRGNP